MDTFSTLLLVFIGIQAVIEIAVLIRNEFGYAQAYRRFDREREDAKKQLDMYIDLCADFQKKISANEEELRILTSKLTRKNDEYCILRKDYDMLVAKIDTFEAASEIKHLND